MRPKITQTCQTRRVLAQKNFKVKPHKVGKAGVQKTSQGMEGGRTKITQICQVRRVLAQKKYRTNENSYCDLKEYVLPSKV